MKLYDSIGPNPHVVRMVLAEKGLDVPRQRVDLRGGENRRPPYMQLNPMGQLPTLELDGGTSLTEITAIAEYVEELHPEPPLIGVTALQRAETRMWVRRLDLNIVEPMVNGYRWGEGLELFQDRIHCVPEASPGLKAMAAKWMAWLDGQMAGREWIVGGRFTLADVMLFCFTRFGGRIGQPIDPARTNLVAWHARVAARPSAAA